MTPAAGTPPTPGPLRVFDHAAFDPARLRAAKQATGMSVSVCLPARNEEATVGAIVACIRRRLVDEEGLVDEVVVVDDASDDATAEVARAAGARVVAAAAVLPACGPGTGKGEALWKSLAASSGDLVAWCDADVTNFDEHFVVGLLGPLLTCPEVVFVKGFYERPVADALQGGGRVTELVARPLLSLLFPHLAGVVQPLGGEYAGRRSVLEALPFVTGYGVDLGLLVDVAHRHGTEAVAQVDLGVRVHRSRDLAALSAQALEVLRTALDRAGLLDAAASGAVPLLRPGLDPLAVPWAERPPLASLPGRRTG